MESPSSHPKGKHVTTSEVESDRFGRGARSFILLVLAQSPSYGYEIRRRLEEFGYERETSDPGALYRLLRDLEAAGSIASQWDVARTGPARRVYTLTGQGRGDLKAGAERMAFVKRRAERFIALYQVFQAQEEHRAAQPHPLETSIPEASASQQSTGLPAASQGIA
jgi:PadR family transcriptional regulator PadR